MLRNLTGAVSAKAEIMILMCLESVRTFAVPPAFDASVTVGFLLIALTCEVSPAAPIAAQPMPFTRILRLLQVLKE